MSEAHSRHEEMELAARKFHEEHPEIWRLFLRFTREAMEAGYENYSCRFIMQRVRWETDMGRSGPYTEDGYFKINNNHTPFYARWFIKRYPQHAEFFRTREQKSMARRPLGRSPDDPREA